MMYVLQMFIGDEESVVLGVYDTENNMRLAAKEFMDKKNNSPTNYFYDKTELNMPAKWNNQTMKVWL